MVALWKLQIPHRGSYSLSLPPQKKFTKTCSFQVRKRLGHFTFPLPPLACQRPRTRKTCFLSINLIKCQLFKRICTLCFILLGGFSISVNPLPRPYPTPPVGRTLCGLEKSSASNLIIHPHLAGHSTTISCQSAVGPSRCPLVAFAYPGPASPSDELSWSLALHKCPWLVHSSPSLVWTVRSQCRGCHRQCAFQLGTLYHPQNCNLPSPSGGGLRGWPPGSSWAARVPEMLTSTPLCLCSWACSAPKCFFCFCFFNTAKG